MKHGKKLTGLVMAGIMTAGVLTGCTNEPSANTASDTKTEDQSAKSETASQEQITLRFMWWGGDERNEATLAVIDQYQKLHPEIKIELR